MSEEGWILTDKGEAIYNALIIAYLKKFPNATKADADQAIKEGRL